MRAKRTLEERRAILKEGCEALLRYHDERFERATESGWDYGPRQAGLGPAWYRSMQFHARCLQGLKETLKDAVRAERGQV